MRRISRGTPYILSATEVENVLRSLTPKMEEHIASLLDISADQWRKLEDPVKVRHIIDFQNRATLAATLAAAAKAHTDLEDASVVVTQAVEADTLRDEVKALREMVHDLNARHQKGARR